MKSINLLDPLQFVYRPWLETERNDLQSWVQDYGIRQWDIVAWCLRRSVEDCREQYQQIISERNRGAGRELDAGLPGWVDTELEAASDEALNQMAEGAKDDTLHANEPEYTQSGRELREEGNTDEDRGIVTGSVVEDMPQIQTEPEEEQPPTMSERKAQLEADANEEVEAQKKEDTIDRQSVPDSQCAMNTAFNLLRPRKPSHGISKESVVQGRVKKSPGRTGWRYGIDRSAGRVRHVPARELYGLIFGHSGLSFESSNVFIPYGSRDGF